MKKRFTDCDIWEDPWYRKMPLIYREFWRYLCAKCDAVGVWKVDLESVGFFLKEQVSEKEALIQFNTDKERVKVLGPDQWFIVGFIEFQYGELSRGCPAHKPVHSLIERHGVDRLGIGYLIGYKYPNARVQEEEKEKNKTISSSSSQMAFEQVWAKYPIKRRGKRGDALEAWARHNPPIWAAEALKKQIPSVDWTKEDGQYIPGLVKWIESNLWDQIRETHNIVACEVCGKEGVLPKGIQGAPKCKKCHQEAIAAQKGAIGEDVV